MVAAKVPVTYLVKTTAKTTLVELFFIWDDEKRAFSAHGRLAPKCSLSIWDEIPFDDVTPKTSERLKRGYHVTPRASIPRDFMDSLVVKLEAEYPSTKFRHDHNGNIIIGDEGTAVPAKALPLGSDLTPPRLEIFRYERDGKTFHKAYCQLNNGTDDWAMISMVDGTCNDAGWRRNTTVEDWIRKSDVSKTRIDPATTRIDATLRPMLEKLAVAAQKYNESASPLVVDASGAIVHLDASSPGQRPNMPTRRQASIRNLHIWI